METDTLIKSESELLQQIRVTPEYKDFQKNHFSIKIDREKRAWALIEKYRGNYTIENLNEIFDTVDLGPGNTRWFGSLIAKPNRNLIFENELARINGWFEQLLFVDQPLGDALDRCIGELKLKGASTGLATLLLYLKDPNACSILLPATQRGLVILGRMNSGARAQGSVGYKEFNDCALGFRQDFNLNPQEIDWYLTFIGKRVQQEAGGYVINSFSAPKKNPLTFESLFQEFIVDFLQQPAGQEHLSSYERNRAQGRANFQAVQARAEQGQWDADLTELVLRTLLPHSDSASNRQRNAWIHVAPAFSGDIRVKFEKIKWAKKEDWPDIARALFHFLQRCGRSPDEFAAAVAEFEASGKARGFQTGALTPMLNALRPDDYCIVNSKPLRIVNHFCKSAYHQTLSDYPAVNRALKDLQHEKEGLLRPVLSRESNISDLFDAFSHWLVAVRKINFGGARYWKIAPGKGAWNWEAWRNEGIATIGWEELGDLSKASRADFEARRGQTLKNHPDWNSVGLEQVWKFAKEIREGDRIVANRGTSEVLGIGTVVGTYEFLPDIRHGHRIPVEWDDIEPFAVEEQGWKRTLIELNQGKFESLEAHKGNPPPVPPPVERNPEYPLPTCAADSGFDESVLSRWVRAIERKGQAVLYGPPGTGKTYMAERLARHLIGGGDGFVELVQFHPTYAYEDFIQGIRPRTREDGAIEYPIVAGRFLEFCQKACGRMDRCVLIVDEINRANLSRVFGELMYLLEYRDRQIPLAGGELFMIPQNVRMIGTMNTADRSIALVDHALRRRFAFLELCPKYDILEHYHRGNNLLVKGLVEVLKRINQQIGDKHYFMGISFFLRSDLPEQIEDIWCMEIEPYLEEYFFDQPSKADEFRWEKVKGKVLGS